MSLDKVVIIDDEFDITMLLRIELETEGYTVSAAHDGEEGLALIRKERPGLVLLDVMMPKMDGHEVLRLLKNDPETKNIPVILLTAKSYDEEIQKGLDLGADDYITKPFHAELLIRTIKRLRKKTRQVVLIDDDPVVTTLLKKEFEKEGYQVAFANDGKKGIEIIKDTAPDLVVLDIIMPVLDGYEVLKMLKKKPGCENVKVIVLTVKGLDEDVQKVLDLGADDCIVKPFHPELVTKKAKNLFKKHR